MVALAPSFSTVYNLLLCLHVLSVYITHQSRNRNYDHLGQLPHDSKRGPKVYMHGRARHPPAGGPGLRRPAALHPPARGPGLRRPAARATARRAAGPSRGESEVESRQRRQQRAGAGRPGPRSPPAGPRGRHGRRRSCSLGSACESPGTPGFPRGAQEGARLPA